VRGTALPWDRRAQDAATAWSHRKGDSSGRIAYQFAAHWVGSELLGRGAGTGPA
jgi:predicted AAA+ superfamily ATPase